MIHEIKVELGTSLAAKGCPFVVVDGPETTKTTTYARERVVVEYDEAAGDSFGPVLSQHKNPKQTDALVIGAKLTIYAQHPSAGALAWEHRRRAHHVLRLVMVALNKILRGRRNPFTLKSGGFVQPEDLSKSESIGGAVYELKFSFETGVPDETWAGAARPELTLAGDLISRTTEVYLAHGPDEQDEETACGT